jgi:small subunit ribosomal protein S17
MTKKETKNKKRMQGKIIQISGMNTLKVRVEIKTTHPLYKKIVKSHKNFLVHSEKAGMEIGDSVIIEEGRPLSKNKSFYLVKKVV